MTKTEDVRAWHSAMRIEGILPAPKRAEFGSAELGMDLVQEESDELVQALYAFNFASDDDQHDVAKLAALAKEGCDLIWVTIGLMLRFGIPVDECWRELVRSNATKTPAQLDESGKLQKGEGYVPADMESVIRRAL